jgi:hypothetical protein
MAVGREALESSSVLQTAATPSQLPAQQKGRAPWRRPASIAPSSRTWRQQSKGWTAKRAGWPPLGIPLIGSCSTLGFEWIIAASTLAAKRHNTGTPQFGTTHHLDATRLGKVRIDSGLFERNRGVLLGPVEATMLGRIRPVLHGAALSVRSSPQSTSSLPRTHQ